MADLFLREASATQGKQRRGKLDLDLRNFAKRMEKQNPNPISSARGAARALSARQLLDFYHYFQEHILSRHLEFRNALLLVFLECYRCL